MNFISNEKETLKMVEIYYDEILKIKNNIIDYLSQYNNFTIDYLKNLNNLHINKANFFEKYIPNKYYNLKELFEISKKIPTLIKEIINSFTFLTNLLTTSINEINKAFEENNNTLKNIENIHLELEKDLDIKIKNIETLKNNFFSKAKEAENLLIEYQKKKKIQKIKNQNKEININKEKIDLILKKMQNAEKEYINSFPNLLYIEESFLKTIEDFTNTKITFLTLNIELINQLIQNFIINYKNSIKMCLVEEDEIRDIIDINLGQKLCDLIEKNKLMKKSFTKFKIEPYKMKLLNEHKIQLFSSDLYKDLSSTEFDEDDIFEIANQIYGNLSLQNPNYNLEIEKEKIITNKITNKILSFSNKKITLEKPTNEELKEIHNLMNSKDNRKIFIEKLNEFRNHGIFYIPDEYFNIISDILNFMLNKVMKDSDFYCANNCLILSQTYYKIENGKKIFLQTKIKDNPIFKSKNFWDDFIFYSIENGKNEAFNVNNQTIYKDENENNNRYSQIAFAQLIPLTDNMIYFGLDKEVIKELINPRIEYYKLNEESVNLIMNLLESCNS